MCILMLLNNSEYFDILGDIKEKIRNAQYRATLTVNKELITLYYNIGKVVIKNSSWGNKFIDNLAKDIKSEFPNTTGYSVRNLKYMKRFAETFDDIKFVQEALAQITWYHHITLMDKVKERDKYVWYVSKITENGWSRNVLVHQIEFRLYERQVLVDKTTNFANVLASPQSERAS
jgi:predicted nuclease of restriction endonuclease-like (RecB) superfamily